MFVYAPGRCRSTGPHWTSPKGRRSARNSSISHFPQAWRRRRTGSTSFAWARWELATPRPQRRSRMRSIGGRAVAWTGPGTGVAGERLETKRRVVAAGVRLHLAEAADPLDLLRRLGGYELAAIAGAVIGARLRRIPVLLDGFVCSAAAASLEVARSGALDHCQVAHVSAEPGHRLLLRRLGKRPLLDLDMRLGEASGAVLAVALVRAAVACHLGMATFEDAGMANREDA